MILIDFLLMNPKINVLISNNIFDKQALRTVKVYLWAHPFSSVTILIVGIIYIFLISYLVAHWKMKKKIAEIFFYGCFQEWEKNWKISKCVIKLWCDRIFKKAIFYCIWVKKSKYYSIIQIIFQKLNLLTVVISI